MFGDLFHPSLRPHSHFLTLQGDAQDGYSSQTEQCARGLEVGLPPSLSLGNGAGADLKQGSLLSARPPVHSFPHASPAARLEFWHLLVKSHSLYLAELILSQITADKVNIPPSSVPGSPGRCTFPRPAVPVARLPGPPSPCWCPECKNKSPSPGQQPGAREFKPSLASPVHQRICFQSV